MIQLFLAPEAYSNDNATLNGPIDWKMWTKLFIEFISRFQKPSTASSSSTISQPTRDIVRVAELLAENAKKSTSPLSKETLLNFFESKQVVDLLKIESFQSSLIHGLGPFLIAFYTLRTIQFHYGSYELQFLLDALLRTTQIPTFLSSFYSEENEKILKQSYDLISCLGENEYVFFLIVFNILTMKLTFYRLRMEKIKYVFDNVKEMFDLGFRRSNGDVFVASKTRRPKSNQLFVFTIFITIFIISFINIVPCRRNKNIPTINFQFFILSSPFIFLYNL